jgi:lysozyme
MTQLQQQRIKAVKILLEKADANIPMLIDYYLDDELRKLLGLPDRPKGNPPYSGWMVSTPIPAVAPTKTSQAGVDLIKRWEGCKTGAYLCPAGVWTIGYGHTSTVKPGMCISYDRAEELLKMDLQRFERTVRDSVTVPLTQPQFDALVSFVYNVGSKAFTNSTLLDLLNQKKYALAAAQFHRWNKAGKVTLKGLIDRRNEEYELFMS